METTTIAKVGAGGIGVTAVVGSTSYGVYALAQPKTIGEKIVWDGGVLLKDEDQDIWEEQLKRYKIFGHIVNSLNFEKKGNNLKLEDLKVKCQTILDTPLTHKETTDNDKIEKAKYWCTGSVL